MGTDLVMQPEPMRSTGTELAVTSQKSTSIEEIRGAMILSHQYRRDENQAFQSLMQTCKRYSFAEVAAYKYPRGGQQIVGPSVNLARSAARVWGNLRYGVDILYDDEDSRHIRGWCWDLETNSYVHQDDSFKKLVQRKGGQWIKPDERDLRELTNRRGAILERNCILKILPKDLIEDAMTMCEATLKADAAKDSSSARKRVLVLFGNLGIPVSELERYLHHPLEQATADELTDLRQIGNAIAGGGHKWSEYCATEVKESDAPKTLDDAVSKARSSAKSKKPAESQEPARSPGELVDAPTLSAINICLDELTPSPQEFDAMLKSYPYAKDVSDLTLEDGQALLEHLRKRLDQQPKQA